MRSRSVWPVCRTGLGHRLDARVPDKGTDFFFLRVQQRADEGDPLAVEVRHGRKAAQTSLVEQIQQQRLDRIVEMMAERDLPAALQQARRLAARRGEASRRASRGASPSAAQTQWYRMPVGTSTSSSPSSAAERTERRWVQSGQRVSRKIGTIEKGFG